MKTKCLFFLIAFLFVVIGANAQSRGQITSAATPAANPMNPNGDGFVTATGASFLPLTPTSNHVNEFELKMFGLPKVGGDVPGDNQNGPNCGGTDLIPDTNGYSVYAAQGPFTYANNTTVENVVFRFRIGSDDPSVLSWHILLDVDNRFGIGAAPQNDPNATASNPGFELDITLITKNNPGVFITYVDGASGCPNPYKFFPLTTNFQISVADLASCSNPDYFYDFFVPVNDLLAAYNTNVPANQQIAAGTGFRYVATTSTSATCNFSGSPSDIGGIDNDDPLYQGNDPAAYAAVIANQCPTAVISLCNTCDGFNTGVTVKPTINTISVGDQVISGGTNPLTSGVYVKISVYSSNGPNSWEATPREEKVVFAASGSWSVTLAGPLQNLDKIVAKVQLTSDGTSICDGLSANSSTAVTVVNNLKPVANPQNVSTPEDTPLAITLTATDGNPGDVITYSVLTQPTNGTLSVVGAAVTYTPNLNYHGPDSFTFLASDGKSTSNTATISITVTPVNDLPIASNQSVSTNEDTPVAITMVATDVDVPTTLTYIIVTPPTNGTLSAVSGAGVTYTPNANYSGPDSYTFKANDGSGDSNTATVSITVNAVNDPPVAVAQSVSVPEDGSVNITLVGTDVEGSSLVYTVVTPPANGTLSGSGANRTYTPNLNYFGPDSFTFKVNDGSVDSNIATVSITVTAINDAPVASNQSLTTPEDTPLPITLSATDVDNPVNTLTYSIVTAPQNGTLSVISGAGVTYTPGANFNGSDSFTYTASDGTATSNTATIVIQVIPVNDAPVANSQSVSVPEDVTSTITLVASDVDGDALTYLLVTPPLHGTISLTSPNVTYTPAANYTGPDSFTFKVNDGTVDSNIATVTINVTPVNDAPVASDMSVSTNEDTALPITLTATDVDAGTTLTYTIISPPTNGVLSAVAGAGVTYTPNANYNGPDSFTFRASDGLLNSNTATVSITVIPVNDAPVANSQSITINEDQTIAITLTGSDLDGNALTYSIVANPTNGTLSGTAPNVTYTPNSNYNGSDSFTFKVNDGTVDSNIATISITINPVNDVPVASNLSVTTPEDTALPITLSATDVDAGTTLTYSIVTPPSNGTLSAVAGAGVTYTPNANYNGPDSFTYRANDGTANSNTATVSITVTPVNDAPVADSQNITINEDQTIAITLTGSDLDGNALTYSIVANPTNGTLSGTAPNVTYTPNSNYNGSDSFTFKVNDGTVDSNIATISITINPVNDVPVASNLSVSTPEDTALPITLSATDVDAGTTLTYSIVTPPSNGTLSAVAGAGVTYTPNANYNGPDSFTYRANDGTANSNTATVSITVTPVNDAPVANDQSVTVNEDASVAITLTASDIDNDPLTYTIVTGPAHGSITGTLPNIIYNPNADYSGPDSFTFKVNDGTTDSNTATVTISVTPINDAPVAFNAGYQYLLNTPLNLVPPLNAFDADGDPLTYTIVTNPSIGSLSGTAPGSLVYTPGFNSNATTTFTFKVNDGTVDSNIATVTLSFNNGVNAAPIASPLNVTVVEDGNVNIVLDAFDPNGDPLTYIIVSGPSNGTLTPAPPGTAQVRNYQPNPNYNGADSFTYKANDGTVDGNVVTVNITVTPVNDVPVANNQTVSVIEDTATPITLTGSDIENSPLTFTVLTQPTNGTLSGTGATVTYTPFANYNGPDAFTFKVNDGTVDSAPATVTIDVTPVNDVPVAAAQNLTTPEDTPLPIILTGTDVEGSTLTYSAVVLPANGTLSCTNCSNPIYTPNLNYNGTDTFTYKVNDGTADSAPATITIIVTPVNDVPIANSQSVTVIEDIAKPITLTGSDIENSPLTFTIVTPPANGVLSGTGANVIYTPNTNYNGPDAFTFKVNDGTVDSAPATVTINVTPVNDVPVAAAQNLTTPEDTPLPIVLTGTDNDGNPLTYSAVALPANGTLSCTNCANPIYTPNLNYNGTDTFTYKVNDGTADSAPATITIIVTPVNDMPIANSQSVTVIEDIAKPITLTGSDIENSPLTFTIVTPPANGVLSGTGANVIYTPNANYNGPDAFTFKVNDGTIDSAPATVTINVTPVNDVPVAVAQNLTTPEDTQLPIILTGTDNDGNPLTYSVVTPPANGILSCSNCANPTYTPNPNYNGPDSFTFKVNDGTADSAPGTISITVTPVNDTPVVNNQSVVVTEDIAEDITLTGSDIEGSVLTYTILTQPTNGTLTATGSNATWTYTPNPNYFGQDSFTFRANDGQLNSNTGTVSITVEEVNDLPVAVNDLTVTTNEDTPVSFPITTNDTDVDGVINPATVDLNPFTPAEDKTLTTAEGVYTVTNAGIVTFTPVLNYNGTTTAITYTVKDDDGGLSNVAQIQIIVLPVNDPPVVTPKTVDVIEDTPTSICIEVTDIENNPSVLSGLVSLSGNGTAVADPANGPFCFLYTPDPDYNGPDQVQVTICDANDPTLCSTGVITINVLPVNDPPRIIREGVSVDRVDKTTPEDTPITFCFEVVDPDGDLYAGTVGNNISGGGTLVLATPAPGQLCLTFTPELNFNGVSTWPITICDDANPSLCGTFTIAIDVTPVNDVPLATTQNVTTVEDTPVAITLSGSDVDGDALTYTIVGIPLNGTLTGTGPNVSYTPNLDYTGPDSFTFKVNDGTIDSDVVTVNINVTPQNDKPIIIAAAPSYTTEEDTPIEVCFFITDPDAGDVLTFSNPINVSGGGTMTLQPDGICFMFVPAKDFNGNSVWKFEVCDNGNPKLCSDVTVTIAVTPVNDPPVAVDDNITVQGTETNVTINLLDNDFDVDGDDLVITTTPVVGPFHGTITINADGTFKYQANEGYVGADSVRYKVCDNVNPSLCDEGVLFIDVDYPKFKIYNALSPNNDGLNDHWRIDGIENYPDNRARVFDRYNNLIFEMSGYDNDENSWRGQANHGNFIKGNMPEGTYFYTLEVDLGNGKELFSGYLVLKKE